MKNISAAIISVFLVASVTSIASAQDLARKYDCVEFSKTSRSYVPKPNGDAGCFLSVYFKLKSQKDAHKWLMLAAEGGDAAAQGMLGGLYFIGPMAGLVDEPTLRRDLKKSVFWIKKGADGGDEYSAITLSEWYLKGGAYIKRSPEKSFEILKKNSENREKL